MGYMKSIGDRLGRQARDRKGGEPLTLDKKVK